VCLRGRWSLIVDSSSDVDLPSWELCSAQAAWLRGARSRLLRRADIARRRTVVDLGAGWGIVSNELCERSGGKVIAIDRRSRPRGVKLHKNLEWIVGRAEQLPLPDASVDLLFAQFVFLWLEAPRAVEEVARVLAPRGVVVVIEPDYGGMMEHPPTAATKDVWLSALQRAGADPCIGRKMPELFAASGLRVESRFPDRYEPAEQARLDLLSELPLTDVQRQRVDRIRSEFSTPEDTAIAHLPLWMVLGEKQPTHFQQGPNP